MAEFFPSRKPCRARVFWRASSLRHEQVSCSQSPVHLHPSALELTASPLNLIAFSFTATLSSPTLLLSPTTVFSFPPDPPLLRHP
jgi:hypothetical protein